MLCCERSVCIAVAASVSELESNFTTISFEPVLVRSVLRDFEVGEEGSRTAAMAVMLGRER
jgi:hypothetical protein